jgi:putative ABC transport system permease protein
MSFIVASSRTKDREHVRFADPTFFSVFSFALLQGDARSALSDPYSVVITESLASKYFGDEIAIGQALTLDGQWRLKVTAVAADVPGRSTIRFGMIAPLVLLSQRPGRSGFLDTWYNSSFSTYLRLAPGVEAERFSSQIADRVRRSDPGSTVTLFLFPFRDLNLRSLDGKGGTIEALTVTGAVAFSVLLLACVNFIALATARTASRAREIGIRTTSGASRPQLATQFFFEALAHVLVAMLVALAITEHALAWFGSLVGAELSIAGSGLATTFTGAGAVAAVACLLAGVVPALVLASVQPARVLRGELTAGPRGSGARRALVVLQLATTTVLLVLAFVALRQHSYLRSKDLGLDPHNLLGLRLDQQLQSRFDPLREELLGHPGVLSVSRATQSVGGVYWTGSGWDWDGRPEHVQPMVTYLGVDPGWREVFDIALVSGRFFNPAASEPGRRELVINETFARLIAEEREALGARLYNREDYGVEPFEIVGVVRDFHFKTLERTIEPLALFDRPQYPHWYGFVRFREGLAEPVLDHLRMVFDRLRPDSLCEYWFIEDELAGMYRHVAARGQVLRVLALLGVAISAIGLFGLTTHLTEIRRREIGIRKVLGASTAGVTLMLTLSTVRWVTVAELLSLPIAYLLASRWLADFPCHITPGIGTFAAAGFLVLATAALTVAGTALRAAAARPAESLRSE